MAAGAAAGSENHLSAPARYALRNALQPFNENGVKINSVINAISCGAVAEMPVNDEGVES